MPLEEMAANPHLITAITRHGGHMGYTSGISPLTHTWTDRLLVHYLRGLSSLDANATSTPTPVRGDDGQPRTAQTLLHSRL